MTFLSKLDAYTPPPPPVPPTPEQMREQRKLACYRLAQERANATGDRHEVWMRYGAITGADFITFRIEGVHDVESAKAHERYAAGKLAPPPAAYSTHRGGYDFIGWADPDPKPAAPT